MKRVRAEVLSTRKVGAYHQLTVVAPEIAEKARPGQFVAVQMPEGREFLLRRHLAKATLEPRRHDLPSPTVPQRQRRLARAGHHGGRGTGLQ